MKKDVWLLENDMGEYEAYESLEDARERAELFLLQLYKSNDLDAEQLIDCLKELTDSYNLETGFWVDEVVWCWKIPYLSRGDM